MNSYLPFALFNDLSRGTDHRSEPREPSYPSTTFAALSFSSSPKTRW